MLVLLLQCLLLCCSHEVDIYEGRQWVGGKVASFVDKDGNHVEVCRDALGDICCMLMVARLATTVALPLWQT